MKKRNLSLAALVAACQLLSATGIGMPLQGNVKAQFEKNLTSTTPEPAIIFLRHAERPKNGTLRSTGIDHAKAYNKSIVAGGALASIKVAAPGAYFTQFPYDVMYCADKNKKDGANPYDTEAFGVNPGQHTSGTFNDDNIIDQLDETHGSYRIERCISTNPSVMQAFAKEVKDKLSSGQSVLIVWDHGDIRNLIDAFAGSAVDTSAAQAFKIPTAITTPDDPSTHYAYNLVGVLRYNQTTNAFVSYDQYNQSYQLADGSTITGEKAQELTDGTVTSTGDKEITGITLQPYTGVGLTKKNTAAK